MDHTILIDRFFRDSGSRARIEWNCFQPPYDAALGWPLRLPDVDWADTDWLVLVFQDFVTMQHGRCVELEQIQNHYQAHADRVIVLHWPYALHRYYTGPIHLVHFNVHEYMILNNLRSNQSQWQHIWDRHRRQSWQCLNGRKCRHRLDVVQHLQLTWSSGTISLGDTVPLADYPYSTYRGTSNEDNWLRLLPVYSNHDVNIVTETQYDQQPGIITEKTIFALLAAQIPIVIGYAGIVRDCQELGFDMFTDVVDVSYDNLPDEQRWQAALDLNRDRITRDVCTAEVRERLRVQARWLLMEWPELHLGRALSRLHDIVNARDWQ